MDVGTTTGRVNLTGIADASDKEMTGRLVSHVLGGMSVGNKLVVDDKAAGQAPWPAAGTWIAAKIKSSFRYAAGMDAFDIKVESRAARGCSQARSTARPSAS